MSNMYTLPSGEKVEIVDSRIETSIMIDLCDAVDNDLEGFLDLISERVTGTPLLSDFSYVVDGSWRGQIVLTVNGDISDILADEEDYS